MQKAALVLIAAALSLGTMFIQPASAGACGCVAVIGAGDPVVDLRTTRYEYSRAFAVFVGRVTTFGGGQAVLDVQRMWKGPAQAAISIQVGSRGPDGSVSRTSCDPSFQVGETYLMYAYGNSLGELGSHTCGGTRLFQYAAQEVLNLDYVVKETERSQADAR